MSTCTPIKVRSQFAALVREAAAQAQRSEAEQLEHWAQLGRAVEAAGAAAPSEEEMAFFEEAMALAHPTPEDDARFADHLRTHGGGGRHGRSRAIGDTRDAQLQVGSASTTTRPAVCGPCAS